MIASATPFRLKWAGGKRWLADALIKGVGLKAFSGGLCEPFAGGASLSLSIAGAGPLHLADTNLDLIETYRTIRDDPESLARRLAELSIDVDTFQAVRAASPTSRLERAVRTIYLNKTAFNGLWRVNKVGQFNVPYGCKPETRMPAREELLSTSELLKASILDVADFEMTAMSTPATVIYFDPPYTVSHNNNGFIRYNEQIFSWSDQQRLADSAAKLADVGRTVVVSNAFHNDLRKLYDDRSFKLYRVGRVTNLAASPNHRGAVDELLAISRDARLRAIPAFATRIN